MKLLEMICKELGVDIGEEWLGSDGFKHRILESGKIEWFESGYGWKKLSWYEPILRGELKPVWKPKEGETYYTPFIDSIDEEMWAAEKWEGTIYDSVMLERGLIFKTKEEAIECANKMLKTIKEEL